MQYCNNVWVPAKGRDAGKELGMAHPATPCISFPWHPATSLQWIQPSSREDRVVVVSYAAGGAAGGTLL